MPFQKISRYDGKKGGLSSSRNITKTTGSGENLTNDQVQELDPDVQLE
jgi:hypothetical protein